MDDSVTYILLNDVNDYVVTVELPYGERPSTSYLEESACPSIPQDLHIPRWDYDQSGWIEGANLSDYKLVKKNNISVEAFSKRQEFLPDYKLINAGMGVYDAQTTADYRATVEAFRTEYYRLESEIAAATDFSGVDVAVAGVNWPTGIESGVP